MKYLNKLLMLILCTLLVFSPCYVLATEESTTVEEGETTEEETPSKEPSEPTETYQVKLDNSELTLGAGKTATIIATTTPEGAKVVWSSSNNSIATVDSNGLVTAGNNAGKTTITAMIEGTDAQATCTVSVTRNQGTDATLKSLTVSNGTLDKKFKSDVYEYTVTIAPDVSELKLDYTLTDERAVVGFNGNKNLEDGDTVTILINAENHTTDKPNQKTYKLKIVKEESSLNLKKLGLNGYALNEVFDPDTQTYTANIPYEIEIVTVEAIPEVDGVSVSISGNNNLIVGQNVVKIEVKDDNGNSKIYKIVVIRSNKTSVEENPTSIITSSVIADSDNNKKTDDSSDNEVLKYVIVSFASLILFAIGGIGIYFYIKTSPKKLRKELEMVKENDSPVIEVNDNQEIVDTNEQIVEQGSNIGSIMDEKLVETREFQMDELNNTKLENLFDDEEDV